MWTLKAKSTEILSRRAGGAQPNLSQNKIKSLDIPVPELHIQEAFGEMVAALLEQASLARAAVRKGDDLFASLQTRAFKGEL